MLIYYCWLTVLIPDYQDAIVAGLVKKGYMVGGAAKNGLPVFTTNLDSPPSALIALHIYHPTDDKVDAKTIYSDVYGVLRDIDAKVFSMIISQSNDSAWYGSNFSLPVPEKVLPAPRKIDPTMN